MHSFQMSPITIYRIISVGRIFSRGGRYWQNFILLTRD